MSAPSRILGVDPGSRVTGYGVVDMHGQRAVHVASGCIRPPDGELATRLHHVFEQLTAVLDRYRPSEAAVEMVFVSRNADSALKLGQARGAALCALADRGVPVAEFTPSQVKQAIVGRGGAEKRQVQHMVRVLLCLGETPPPDAADALAVALCHGHTRSGLMAMPGVSAHRSGRAR